MMNVKICGITDFETAAAAVEAGADALGFVFADSKRKITPLQAKDIIRRLPAGIEKIGVFVNSDPKTVEEISALCGLTMVQLHGDEDAADYQKMALPLIKAAGIGTAEDLKQAIGSGVPYLLADAPKGRYRGGNGETFDWRLLQTGLPASCKLILAGGLHAGNVREAIRSCSPYMVDVSSGVETDGKKDLKKIRQFIAAAKGEGMG